MRVKGFRACQASNLEKTLHVHGRGLGVVRNVVREAFTEAFVFCFLE